MIYSENKHCDHSPQTAVSLWTLENHAIILWSRISKWTTSNYIIVTEYLICILILYSSLIFSLTNGRFNRRFPPNFLGISSFFQPNYLSSPYNKNKSLELLVTELPPCGAAYTLLYCIAFHLSVSGTLSILKRNDPLQILKHGYHITSVH